MLWYRTEGCPERFAFNAGESLKSGFAKVGLFPFSPDVIRESVRAHHDPELQSGIRVCNAGESFSSLFEVLITEHGISSEKDREDVTEFVSLKKKGITPGAALANSIQKVLFSEAPKKQRRPKNKQLSTDSGALVTSEIFVSLTEKHEAEKQKKKADATAKRKSASSDILSCNIADNSTVKRAKKPRKK